MIEVAAPLLEQAELGEALDALHDHLDALVLVGAATSYQLLERALIVKASEESGWNQSKTARLLNVKRDKLRYRMKSFNIGDETEVETTT